MLNIEYAPVEPQALLLCYQLHESRTAIVSSTVTMILGQLLMFVFDNLKVIEQDHHLLLAIELESITLLGGTTLSLGPAARDMFAIFEGLCLHLLGNGERPQFLQLGYQNVCSRIESVLTNYCIMHSSARHVSPPAHSILAVLTPPSCQRSQPEHSELLLLLQYPPLRAASQNALRTPAFPITLREISVVSLKQISSELATGADIFSCC